MRPARRHFDTQDIIYRQTLKKLTRFTKNHLYLITLAIAIITGLYDSLSGWNGFYGDADGYMRALRVKNFILNPSYYETPVYESNYPFGEILHWTRPMDILWSVLTLPFLVQGYGLKDAVFVSGFFLSPLLYIFSALVLAYGLRRHFNVWLTLFGIGIFSLAYTITNAYAPAHPDHHALMSFLSLCLFSFTLCWLKKRHNRYLRLTGVVSALSVFTAVEGIIIHVLILTYFIVLYIFKNLSLTPSVKISKYFALSLTLFLFLNPPYQGLFYPDNGRLSVIFVSLGWLVFLALYILEKLKLHTSGLKLVSLLLAATCAFLLLIALFGPTILLPPLDKELSAVWSSQIVEMRSFYQIPWEFSCEIYTFPALSLATNLFMLKKSPRNRLMLLNLTLGIPLFLLSLFAIRFQSYCVIYITLPFLSLTKYLYETSPFAKHQNTEFPGIVWLSVFLTLMTEYATPFPYAIRQMQQKDNSPANTIYSSSLCQSVSALGGTLLTDTFRSPQYVYNCNVTTVNTPYHRNRQGILDAHTILNVQNDSLAIPLLLKHQITQILLFENYGKKYYDMSPQNADKLYYRLIKKQNIPPYLEPVSSPLPNVRHYRIKF